MVHVVLHYPVDVSLEAREGLALDVEFQGVGLKDVGLWMEQPPGPDVIVRVYAVCPSHLGDGELVFMLEHPGVEGGHGYFCPVPSPHGGDGLAQGMALVVVTERLQDGPWRVGAVGDLAVVEVFATALAVEYLDCLVPDLSLAGAYHLVAFAVWAVGTFPIVVLYHGI